jgi:hypothetical protein
MTKLALLCGIFGAANLILAMVPPIEWQLMHLVIGAAGIACWMDSWRYRVNQKGK